MGMVVYAHNASTWEVQTGFGSSNAQQVGGQYGLQVTLSQDNK